MSRLVTFVLICLGGLNFSCGIPLLDDSDNKWPTVTIAILVRNKAHSLPYFLSCLYNLNYPKDRLFLWIHSDFNDDRSLEILDYWSNEHKYDYHGFYRNIKNSSYLSEEKISREWNNEHFQHVIKLRNKAFDFAKNVWSDYVFMLDADVYLTNPLTLKSLTAKNKVVVAPMLLSDGLYSNFWGGMTENYYYHRTEYYTKYINREKTGCFKVPMVHSAVLISLRKYSIDNITYDPTKIEGYDGPLDDIIAFAVNTKQIGIDMFICNDHVYGFVQIPLDKPGDENHLLNEQEQLLNVKLEALSRGIPLPLNEELELYVTYPPLGKLSCSEIFMINLERRKERRQLMELSFKEIGIQYKLFVAIDGRDLDLDDLKKHSVTLMPNYEDPYHKRPMKAGEIGCFLSHYYIWKEILERRLEKTLVLEDDIHFTPYFQIRFAELLKEIAFLDWDLVYIGRKVLVEGETFATEHTTRPLYTYWTLGYLLTMRGARKLIDAKPLDKMLPVDEFLPIMFDQHPNDTWKSYFPNRNLIAFSAAPLLVLPTHFTGQEGYVSDTEDSHVVASDCKRDEL